MIKKKKKYLQLESLGLVFLVKLIARNELSLEILLKLLEADAKLIAFFGGALNRNLQSICDIL